MKSGGPWNLRGLRPEAREAARDAARRSGMSVGEWLNTVIAPGDEDYGEPMRLADYDDDDDGWRHDYRRALAVIDSRDDYREPRAPAPAPPRTGPDRDYEREAAA